MPISVNGANGITFADGSIQNTGAAGFGFKNRIINGAMVIDQRNVGASVTTASSGTYTLDRWDVQNNSGASRFTVQQNAGSVTPPVGFTNYLGVTSTGAYSVSSGDVISIRQKIEGYNTADFAWGTANAATVTMSFWVRSSLTGTFGGAFKNASASYSYPFTYTINSANTWEQKTITITGATSSSWATTTSASIEIYFNMGTGASYTGTAGAWAAADYRSPTGAVSVVGTSGATWYLTGVQLEKGSTATAFDYRDYGRELIMCQRYYERMEAQTQFWVPNTSYLSHAINLWQFRVVKRTPPTLSAISGASITMDRYGIGPPTVTGNGIDSATQFTARAYVNFNTNYTCGEGITLQSTYWQASAEL